VPQQVAQLQVRALPFAHGHLRQAARGPGPNMGGGLDMASWLKDEGMK
jgi:hypothetical protein